MRIIGPIPNHILERMRPEDRPKGVTGMTAAEIHLANVDKAEKALSGEVRRYLNLLEIPFICPPANRKSTLPVGWTDYTLAYRGVPIAWELKAVSGSLRPEQVKMRERLIAHGWQWRLIRHLGEAQNHLREIAG